MSSQNSHGVRAMATKVMSDYEKAARRERKAEKAVRAARREFDRDPCATCAAGVAAAFEEWAAATSRVVDEDAGWIVGVALCWRAQVILMDCDDMGRSAGWTRSRTALREMAEHAAQLALACGPWARTFLPDGYAPAEV